MINKNLTNQQLLALIQTHRAEIDSAKLRLQNEKYLAEDGTPIPITDACWLANIGADAVDYNNRQIDQAEAQERSRQRDEERNNF